MQPSDIGIYWIWFLLIAYFCLRLADKGGRDGLRNFLISLWRLCRLLWDGFSYMKEAEPVGEFFEGMLARLLRSGFNNATAYVKPKYSRRRIEFRKYIRKPGNYGIELRFPRDGWATPYVEPLRKHCEARNIPYRIATGDGKTSRRHLCVDMGQDVEAAVNLTLCIWTEIFGLSANAPRSYSGRRISTWGELVDRADQQMMSLDEGWRYIHPEHEEPPAGCGFAIWGIARIVVSVGLFATALTSRGTPVDWSVQVAGSTLAGTTTGLVFFILYLLRITVGSPVETRLLRAILTRPTDPEWLKKLYRPFRWLRQTTLPIAVILVWTH